MPRLIQLPDGDWIDPNMVFRIDASPASTTFNGQVCPPYVNIRMWDRDQEIIDFLTYEDACKARDDLAAKVNEARGERFSRKRNAPRKKPGSITDAIQALRDAGGSDWDKIDDPEAYLGRK